MTDNSTGETRQMERRDLQQAIKTVGDINFPMQLAAGNLSPSTLIEMLADLEMAVQNAKAVAQSMLIFEAAPDSE